jgi:sulfur relay (sulfurtransferase) DsrC/TusE family protein
MIDITDEMQDLHKCYEKKLSTEEIILKSRHNELVYFLEKYLREYKEHELTKEKFKVLNEKIDELEKLNQEYEDEE